MSASRIAVSATEREWIALLAALPRCACRGLAEVRVDGVPLCISCAAAKRRGRLDVLGHADVALRIHDAIGPLG